MKNLGPGRLVHYRMAAGAYRPLLVVNVRADGATVDGYLFHAGILDGEEFAGNGPLPKFEVKFSPTGKPGTWRWAEKNGGEDAAKAS